MLLTFEVGQLNLNKVIPVKKQITIENISGATNGNICYIATKIVQNIKYNASHDSYDKLKTQMYHKLY
jgi:hypothetical protein